MEKENETKNEEQGTTQERPDTSEIYPVANTEPANSSEEKPEPRERLSRYERWQVGSAIAGVLLAGFGLCLLYKQAAIMETQSQLMGRQNDIMDVQTNLMNRQLAEIREAGKQAAGQSLESLKASTAQSKAALDASIKALRLDQRPWLVVHSCKLSAEPERGKPFTINCIVSNTGKTPAIGVTAGQRVIISTAVSTMIPVPDSKKIYSQSIIPPMTGMTGFPVWTDPLFMRDDLLALYVQKKATIYIRIRLEYSDAFKVPHWTNSCAYRNLDNQAGPFIFCESGNEMDRN